eukprot:1656566-Rhodomonas_salina.1
MIPAEFESWNTICSLCDFHVLPINNHSLDNLNDTRLFLGERWLSSTYLGMPVLRTVLPVSAYECCKATKHCKKSHWYPGKTAASLGDFWNFVEWLVEIGVVSVHIVGFEDVLAPPAWCCNVGQPCANARKDLVLQLLSNFIAKFLNFKNSAGLLVNLIEGKSTRKNRRLVGYGYPGTRVACDAVMRVRRSSGARWRQSQCLYPGTR